MNGFQGFLTLLVILVIAEGNPLEKYNRGPGNVYHGRYSRDLREPEFLIPRRVHHDGSFDAYSQPKFYEHRALNELRKRSNEPEVEADELHLVLPFNGIEYRVELAPNHDFISLEMVIETRGAGLRTNLNEALRFKRAPELQWHYRGFVRGHDESKGALSLCDGVVGYVQTNHDWYFVESVSESEPESDGRHVHGPTDATVNATSRSVMNGFQGFLTFLVILVIAEGNLLEKYNREPGNVYHGRYTRDLHEPEFLIPRRVRHDGSFHTYSLPKFYQHRVEYERTKRSDEEEAEADKLHLVLPFKGIEHHVELVPNHDFISPEMVIETRGAGLRTNLNEALRFKRAPEMQCHYRGFVRGHDGSKAALSLCDGVVGYVQTNHGRYFVEPVSESEPESDGQHVHVAYKRKVPLGHGLSPTTQCGTDENWEAAWAEQLAKREKRLLAGDEPKKSSQSSTHSIHRYLEIGLVADRKFLDYYNNTDHEQYLLTVMNMVSDYYHDSSIGNQIDVVLVRIIYLEKESEEIDLEISPAAEKTLDSFAAWADKMNPKDNDHPNHFDISVLVTRHDICSLKSGCGLTGLAFTSTACDRTKASCINEDMGLQLGIVIAHEVGHVLGCGHDESNGTTPGCKPQDKDDSYFVMSPYIEIFTIRWSPCSRKFVTTLLESMGECLIDNPKKPSDKYKLPGMLPGAMYDADFQCSQTFPGSRMCHRNLPMACDSLWCETNSTFPGSCNSMPRSQRLDGTKCGENKWCIRKECVDMGTRPAAVHGKWGSWGPMGTCSRTCGGGVKFSERECDSPPPSNGGRYCMGERKKAAICNTKPCDIKKPPFRAVQCSSYDNVEILADGLHTWKPFSSPDIDVCGLFCVNEKNAFVKVQAIANDSTPCKAGTNNMCISGVCRTVGCDWVLDSDAIDDNCGVCKGTGSGCKAVEGVYNNTKPGPQRVKITTIPKGARSISVKEEEPHKNILSVRLENNETGYCLNPSNYQQRSGDYECQDVLIIYLHPQPKMEHIQIKGPLTQEIRIEMMIFDRTRYIPIFYKYYMPTGDTSYKPKYLWEFDEWSKCSALCGGGTMTAEASCIEENGGKVSVSFCQGTARPEAKSRTCNTEVCPAKWRVSQWSKCNACDGNKGFKHRKVQCVRPAARAGEDDVQANLDACKGRVPKQKEECVGQRPCRKKCPKTRDVNTELDGKNFAGKMSAPATNQDKIIDAFVDLSLARYLDKAHGTSREMDEDLAKARDNAKFRQLSRDWLMLQDAKRKRSNCLPNNLTMPQPGTIFVDRTPLDKIALLEAPIMDESLQMNLSDRAYQETGDIVGIGIDTAHQKVYTGMEAVKKINELRHPGMTTVPTRVNENYTYDRLARLVDAVDQR